MSVAITGLGSAGSNDDRLLAQLTVEHNGEVYDWAIFIPPNLDTDLASFIQSKEATIRAEIDRKETEWNNLSAKTREITNPMSRQVTVVNISKSEIVRPEIPDYYVKRKNEYPPIAEQLDAIWKGGDAMTAMANKIRSIKEKYPKS